MTKRRKKICRNGDEFRHAMNDDSIAEMFMDAYENSNYGVLSEIPEFVKPIKMRLFRGVSGDRLESKGKSYSHSDWHMWAKDAKLALKFADSGGKVLTMTYTGQAVDVDLIYRYLWEVYESDKKKWAYLGGMLREYWSFERGSLILPPNCYQIQSKQGEFIEVEPT